MATNNVINAPIPFSPAKGGTGIINPAANGVLVGNGASPLSSIVLNDGQLLIGTTGSPPSAATLTAGAGISISNGAGSISISSSSSGTNWNNVSSNAQLLSPDQGYITNNGATLVVYILPAVCAQGDEISIAGFSAGGWVINQNASQQIIFGNTQTTIGVTGTLASTNNADQVSLLCVTANLTWVVLRSAGNLTTV